MHKVWLSIPIWGMWEICQWLWYTCSYRFSPETSVSERNNYFMQVTIQPGMAECYNEYFSIPI